MKKNNQQRGYTIVETMIAVSLFLTITTAGMGALLNANLLHQKSQSMRSVLDNLSFIMEDMSKNLRTGSSYHCFISGDIIPLSTSPIVSTPKSCANGWALAFEPSGGLASNNDDQWVYYIDDTGKIFKSTAGPYIVSNFIQLSPDEVVIDTTASGFSILGAEGKIGDSQQPFITIRLVGKITFKNVVTPFSLQTSVSQRLIDV